MEWRRLETSVRGLWEEVELLDGDYDTSILKDMTYSPVQMQHKI